MGEYHRQKGVSMYQFFVEEEQISETDVLIRGSDVNHIRKVLRMRCGETIRISSSTGRNLFCSISEMTEYEVRADILEDTAENTELPNKIYLFQGLPKNDKMELIIQKAVELGVYEVTPVAMKNCVVKLDEKKAAAKTARWQEIAKSAAKQSKRSLIPQVFMPVSYKEAWKRALELDVILIPYENERGMQATREVLSAIKPGESIGIFIGPEGGFDSSEVETARENAHLISLGNRILRTETAGLAALSMLIYQLEQ